MTEDSPLRTLSTRFKEKIVFYVRIKQVKRVLFKGILRSAHTFTKGVHLVNAYDHRLVLAVTPLPAKMKGGEGQPWYIISNDTRASLEDISRVYYYRSEIEELFKDAKRLFGLEYVRFHKVLNFQTVLWFVIAGFWLHAYLETMIHKAKTFIKKCKKSFNQSITHYWLEQTRYALQAQALGQITIRDAC